MDEMSNTPEKVKPGRKPRQSKVKEVEVETPQTIEEPVFKPKKRKIREYLVIVNGKERMISKPTFNALQRDPVNFKLEVPEGSDLVEPIVDKPCKNC